MAHDRPVSPAVLLKRFATVAADRAPFLIAVEQAKEALTTAQLNLAKAQAALAEVDQPFFAIVKGLDEFVRPIVHRELSRYYDTNHLLRATDIADRVYMEFVDGGSQPELQHLRVAIRHEVIDGLRQWRGRLSDAQKVRAALEEMSYFLTDAHHTAVKRLYCEDVNEQQLTSELRCSAEQLTQLQQEGLNFLCGRLNSKVNAALIRDQVIRHLRQPEVGPSVPARDEPLPDWAAPPETLTLGTKLSVHEALSKLDRDAPNRHLSTIAKLLLEGYSQTEIANILGISPVEVHRRIKNQINPTLQPLLRSNDVISQAQ